MSLYILWSSSLTDTCQSAGSEKKSIMTALIAAVTPERHKLKGDAWDRFMRKPNRVMNAILAFQLKMPTFLKSHYLLHWGYEQLSISSAILDPLTFQFLVWLAGVWSPDMNWAWPWYLCLVWAILMDIMGVMDFKWLLSLYFRPVWHYNQTTGSWNFCFYIRQTLHLSFFFFIAKGQ